MNYPMRPFAPLLLFVVALVALIFDHAVLAALFVALAAIERAVVGLALYAISKAMKQAEETMKLLTELHRANQ